MVRVGGRVILRFLKVLGRQGDAEYAVGTFGRVYYRFPDRCGSHWTLAAF